MKRGRFSPGTSAKELQVSCVQRMPTRPRSMRCSRIKPLRPLVLLERTGAIEIGAAGLACEALGVLDERVGLVGSDALMKSVRRTRSTQSTKRSSSEADAMARCPLKITRSKQCSVQTIRLANLTKNRHTVAHGILPRLADCKHQPFWRTNAIFASEFRLRLSRVKNRAKISYRILSLLADGFHSSIRHDTHCV